MKKKKRICRLALTIMMALMLIFSSVEAAYATTLIEALSSGTVNPVSSANYNSEKNTKSTVRAGEQYRRKGASAKPGRNDGHIPQVRIFQQEIGNLTGFAENRGILSARQSSYAISC